MSEEKLLKKPKSVKELALGMAAYTGVSTFGPIIFFGIAGYILDRVFETNPLFLIAGISLAFIITNALIYKKISVLIKKFEELDAAEKEAAGRQETQEENKEK